MRSFIQFMKDDGGMAGVELCEGCLRENEEEVADQWCNDCSEPVCRNCGKAHRRFAVAHNVISIKDVPACRKSIPKNCLTHENKKLILFCIGHDKLICHECLSENHRTCNKILEIEKAAEGIKNSHAINDMKTRMIKLISVLEKTQIENEQQLSKINAEKQFANDHMKEVSKCFICLLSQIENNLKKNYYKIVEQNKENGAQLFNLKQSLQENMDWLSTLEENSSDSNMFHALKHLDTIQVSSEKHIAMIKRDLVTMPLDVLPEGKKFIENIFQEFQRKSSFRSFLPIANLESECKQSQVKVKKQESLHPPPRYQEFTSGIDSAFGALCFTEDGRIVIEEYVLCKDRSRNCFLRIFDIQTNNSKQIKLNNSYIDVNLNASSMCMHDKFILLTSTQNITGILVFDIELERTCRNIYLKDPDHKFRFRIIEIKWVSCKNGKIFVLAMCHDSIRLFSIEFSGTVVSDFNLSDSIANVDFDGRNMFFYTDKTVNDIYCITFDKSWKKSKCYSSLDLTDGCGVLHITGNVLLLLEKSTNTVYKLDIANQRRSILIQQDIVNPAHFNLSLKLKKIAITMDDGKRIRIFPL